MILGLKKLLHLPVFTKSGARLGKITDADFDADSQSVLKYRVDAGVFSEKQHLIDRSQVLEIGDTKMVVEDAMLAAAAGDERKQAAPQTALGGMAQRAADEE